MAEPNVNAGGAGVTPDPPAGRNPFSAISFTIEIATSQNNMVMCPITKRKLRGRFDQTNLKNRVPDDRFANCPVIPGIRIVYDGGTKTVKLVDPLSSPTALATLKAIQASVQAMGWAKPNPQPTVTYNRLDTNGLKAWVYWARRWLDCDQCQVMNGNVPEMDTIEKLPGHVERHQFDTSQRVERFPKQTPRYLSPAQAAGVAAGNDDGGYTDDGGDGE